MENAQTGHGGVKQQKILLSQKGQSQLICQEKCQIKRLNLPKEQIQLMNLQVSHKTTILEAINCALSEQASRLIIFKIHTSTQSIKVQEIEKNMLDLKAQQFHKTLSKTFTHCHFINMKYLYIWNNPLNNCEFLGFLEAPQLQRIFMSSIKASQYKALDKGYLKSLEILNVEKNHSNKMQLTRAKLGQFWESLIIEFSNQDLVVQENLGVLVKMQVLFFDRIRIQSKLRIQQGKLRNKLKERFVKLDKTVQLL